MSTPSADFGPRPLRLWPALVLLALLWLFRLPPALLDDMPPAVFMAAFFGPLICTLLVLIWWVTASRASWKEKVAGFFGFLALLVGGFVLSHPSVRGFGTVAAAIPWGTTAFVVGIFVGARWQPRRRTAIALLIAALGFGFWTVVRMEGVWGGNLKFVQSWRWEQTAEERFLAARDDRAKGPELQEPVAEAEWPGFRGPNRDGVVPGIALAEDWEAEPPRELWRIRVGPGWSSFAVAGRRLFTQEQRGEMEAVSAYDAESGRELWAHAYPSRFFEALGGVGPRATPTLSAGRLFALGAEGWLHRLDPESGTVIWKADLRRDADREPPTWGFSSSPLVVGGLVIVHAGGDGDRGLLAYGADDGRLRWGAPAGGHSYSSPQLVAVAGRRAVAMVTDAGVALHEPSDGALVWKHDWPYNQYRVLQPLVVGESTLLVGTSLGQGTRRLDLAVSDGALTATEVWTSRGMKPDFNDYVAFQGSLYGFDPNILAAIDLETGERHWKRGRYGAGQLLLLPDAAQLLVMGEKGDLVLVRATPEEHRELTRYPVLGGKTWNHPALVGNRLFVRNSEEAVALEMPLQSADR